MGYLTHYDLKIEYRSGPEEVNNCEHSVPSQYKYCPVCGIKTGSHPILDDILETHIDYWDATVSDLVGGNQDDSKWYEHQNDMRILSAKYPGFLFILSGEGEESGDIWTEYHLGGKMQVARAKMVVDPFDPAKLK